MPKIKTHKSSAKRLHLSGSGKLTIRKMSARHRARFKSNRALQQASKTQVIVTSVVKRKLRRLANI